MSRLETLREIFPASPNALNLGAKATAEGGLRMDIDPVGRPDVLGSALAIPLATGTVERVLFTDVIEHLPKGTESEALAEIFRVLRPGGRLLLSTPNHYLPFTLSDPAYWLQGHRHYTPAAMRGMLEQAGFRVVQEGTFGGTTDAVALLWMYAFFPAKKVLGRYPAIANAIARPRVDPIRSDGKGYTLFFIVEKPPRDTPLRPAALPQTA